MKLELSRQVFEKSSNIKFHENPSLRAELFHVDESTGRQAGRQRDRYDEAKS
jgi:hypothetical protein